MRVLKTFSMSVALLGIVACAHAADMPIKAPANPFAYPASSGLYFGVGTVGGGGSAQVNAPGVNSASLVTNQIGVAGIVGYTWGVAGSPMFVAVESWFGWNNINGSVPGLSFSGPAQFTQRFMFGAPTDQILSVLPISNANLTPPPFVLPPGQSVLSSKAYIAGEITEKDVSLNVGAVSNRQWTVVPGISVGVLNVLTKGNVIDTAAVVEFDDKGVCIGGGAGCGKLSTTYLARVAFKW